MELDRLMLELKLFGWAGLAMGWASIFSIVQVSAEEVWFRGPLLVAIVLATIGITGKVFSLLNKWDKRQTMLYVRQKRIVRAIRENLDPSFRFDDDGDDDA